MKSFYKSLIIIILLVSTLIISFTYTFSFTQNKCLYDNWPFSDNIKGDSVTAIVTHIDGTKTITHSCNLVTNLGEDVISNCVARSATGGVTCTNGLVYIAITTDTTAPSATDTTCTSEETTNGLGRALGTYAHTIGTSTYTITVTFTQTATQTKVLAKACMFDASSSGNLGFETLFASTATLTANGDKLTVVWTLNH